MTSTRKTVTVRAMIHGNQEVVRGRVPVLANRDDMLAILGGVMGSPEWDGVWDKVDVDLVGLFDQVADVENLVKEAVGHAMEACLEHGDDGRTAEELAEAYLVQDYSPEETRRGAALWWSMTREEQRETVRLLAEAIEHHRFLMDLEAA